MSYDKASEIIEKNHLMQDPVDLPPAAPVVVSKSIPEMRSVVFINNRDAGKTLSFRYCSKTHPLHSYDLIHGHEYDLPVEIIQHVESLAQKEYEYVKGEDGNPKMRVKALKYLFQFRSPASRQNFRAA